MPLESALKSFPMNGHVDRFYNLKFCAGSRHGAESILIDNVAFDILNFAHLKFASETAFAKIKGSQKVRCLQYS
jgi:hypothetical protein